MGMIYEIGVVTERKNGAVTVKIPRKSACDKCGACGIKPKDASISITVENVLSGGETASVGDTVEVGIGASSFLVSSAIVYVLPLIFSAIGVLVGVLTGNELLGTALFFAFLLGGFGVVAFIDRTLKRKKNFANKLVRVVKRSESQG